MGMHGWGCGDDTSAIKDEAPEPKWKCNSYNLHTPVIGVMIGTIDSLLLSNFGLQRCCQLCGSPDRDLKISKNKVQTTCKKCGESVVKTRK